MEQNYSKNLKYWISGLLLICTTLIYAQVGIGTTDPKTQLDVNGALSLKEGAPLTLVNGINTNIDLGTTPFSLYRIEGPTASFSIASIIPETGSDGQIVTFVNTTDQTMTVNHTSSGGARRIFCTGETDFILDGRYSTVTLQYNATNSKWILINSSIPVNDWKINGNSNTFSSTNFIGTTNAEDVVIKTNSLERFRASASETILNEDSEDVNFRVESDDNANMLFVEAENNSVGIGTNTPRGALDITSSTNGVIFPRVLLTSTAVSAPVVNPNGGGLSDGLLVYNTNTSSSGNTAVSPGYYYWDTNKWIAMDGTNGKDWSLEGNAGTNSASNFLGTIDNISLIFRTNNNERMRVVNDGRVSVNNINPFGGDRFTVTGSSGEYAINSYASGAGVGVYAINTGSGDTTVSLNTGTGLGTYSSSANTHGVFAITAYTGGAFLTGGIIGWGSGNNGANGVLAVTDKQVSSRSNMGLRAVSGSTTSISSSQIMNVGVNSNATDLALYTLTEGPITSLGILEAARFQTNYTGSAINADARDPRAQLAGYTNNSQVGGSSMYYGGYFYSGGSSSNSSYAYAGARYGGTNYKIIGNGAVSTIVEGSDGKDKVMFAPEAPEVLFEDYGTGRLNNGNVYINLDKTLAKNIIVDEQHPLKVFIQLEGECNGVFVSEKSLQGFFVKELKAGTSNVSFSWHIVANRKDVTNRGESENSLYSELRFPDAPKAILAKDNKKVEIKNENVDKYSRLLKN